MSEINGLKGLVKNIIKLKIDISYSLTNAKQIKKALERKNELKYQAYVAYMQKINSKRLIKRNIAKFNEFRNMSFTRHNHVNRRAYYIYYAISDISKHIERLKIAMDIVRNQNTSEMILDEEFYKLLKLYDMSCINTEDYLELSRYI